MMELYILVSEIELRVRTGCTRTAAVRSFKRWTCHHQFGHSDLYHWPGKGPARLVLSKVGAEYVWPRRPTHAAAA